MKFTRFLPLLCILALLGCREQVVYPTLGPETPLAAIPNFPTTNVQTPVAPDTTPPITPGPVSEDYIIKTGDTLSDIADRYDMTVDELMQLNNLTNANLLTLGQVLHVRIQLSRIAPANKLIPDSEMVYSPAYSGFDTDAFVAKSSGFLKSYTERVDGDLLTGAQIVQLIAERYSVGPRVLLALLEFQSHWVTGQPNSAFARNFPFGEQDGNRVNLYKQVSWAANTLNEGYYGKIAGRIATLQFKDRTRAQINPAANLGTVGLQYALASTMNWSDFLIATSNGDNSYLQTYRALFGDPNAHAIEPLVPPDLKQPSLRLPFGDGETWYFTGGPHGGWDSGSAWAAVDFAPPDQAGTCWTSIDWAISIAPGRVVRAEHGRVIVRLDGTDFASPGWALLYMHMAAQGRVAVGTDVNVGDHIGHPSCEGGAAETSHLHLARLYNGQWMAADGAVPYVLSGWQIFGATEEYDGKMVRGGTTIETCNCRDDKANAVAGDGGK